MSAIIIISQNNKSVVFWQSQLETFQPILKVRSAFDALQFNPELIIVDDYFNNEDGHDWFYGQILQLKMNGFQNTIIGLSPQFIDVRKLQIPSETNLYYHHFSQSFIDAVSKSAA